MERDDFEAAVGRAFLVPAQGGDRPDLVEPVLARVARADARRRLVLAGAGLVGAAITAALLGLVGAAGSVAAAARAAVDQAAPAPGFDGLAAGEPGLWALAAFAVAAVALIGSRALRREF